MASAVPKKTPVFLSHIPAEKEIAAALKKLVEEKFLGRIEVFVSSATSIPLGNTWLSDITKALKACKVEIVLASPESVRHPWIDFEAGAGWVRDIPVIPLCHSGMTLEGLPYPLRILQGAVATDVTQLREKLFPVLADASGCAEPPTDFSEFIGVVKTFEENSRQNEAMEAVMPIAATDGLMPHEFATLVEIGGRTSLLGDRVDVLDVRNDLVKAGHTGIAVTLAIEMLSRKNLVETNTVQTGEDEWRSIVRITSDGLSWLQANMDKLSLTIPRPTQLKPPPPHRPQVKPPERPSGEGQRFKEDDFQF